jgi:hypothetical protein
MLTSREDPPQKEHADIPRPGFTRTDERSPWVLGGVDRVRRCGVAVGLAWPAQYVATGWAFRTTAGVATSGITIERR